MLWPSREAESVKATGAQMASGGMATGTTAIPEGNRSLALVRQLRHRTLLLARSKKADVPLVAQMATRS